MKKIQVIVERKSGGKWETTFASDDQSKVYEELAKDLIAKKIHKCTYIKTIKDVCNYDGTRDIAITYDNNVRRIYTIKW